MNSKRIPLKTQCLFLCIIIITLFITGCGTAGADIVYTSYSPRQIAEVVIAAQEEPSPMQVLTPDNDFFRERLSDAYQLDIDKETLIDGIIFFAGGVIADEIAVLLFADGADLTSVADTLEAYRDRRMVTFAGYAPEQAALLRDSIVSVHGNHVALLIAADARGAETAFLSCFGDNPPPLPAADDLPQITVPTPATPIPPLTPAQQETPDSQETSTLPESSDPHETSTSPESPDPSPLTDPPGISYQIEAEFNAIGYDPAAILLARETGDTSGLTEGNRRILEQSLYILDTLITDDMDEIEKQQAVLDWIIVWSVYDPDFFSNAPGVTPNPNNGNPYGLLFDQVAICWGFAYTFQLFMDLLGIECITVHGYDFFGGRHAWNLVRTDGTWYAVDVTFDVTLNNPLGVDSSHVPENITHGHFRVSSQLLCDIGHYWDRDAVPEAPGPGL